jgi:hypothetical protein
MNTKTYFIARLAVGAVIALAAVGCKKGSVSGSGGGSSSGGTITVTKAYPTSAGSGATAITTTGPLTYYVKGLDVSVTGTCSPGIAYVRVSEGGSYYPGNTACDVSGTYTFSRTFVGGDFAGIHEESFALTVDGFGVDDALIAGATANVNVWVDDVAPAAPTRLAPATTPYVHQLSTGANTITVTEGDTSTVRMQMSRAGLNVNMTNTHPSTTWTYAADPLILGQSARIYSFYAYDLAGNVSTPALQTSMVWAPGAELTVSGTYSAVGAEIMYDGPAASDYYLSATVGSDGGTAASGITKYLDLNFKKIIDELRSP